MSHDAHSTAEKPTVLRGKVRNLIRRRETARFFFEATDEAAMGGIAIAAAAAGLGAQAVGTATAVSDLEETADHLSFWIGEHRCKGWVWRSPIREGDSIEVVGSPGRDHFELYAITRPFDRTIAMCPHMSRGSAAHWINAYKLCAWGFVAVQIFVVVVLGATYGLGELNEPAAFALFALVPAIILLIFFAVMTYFLARRWMKFVRPAEQIFAALDWPDPERIDLVKSSKRLRRDTDNLAEYGVYYFRY